MLVKLEWLGYRMVKKIMTICWAVFIQLPACHGQTDRQTDRRTELVYQYRASAVGCWRAIKTNDPKVFKLGVENDLEVVLFWGSKVKGQGHRVSKFILHTRTAIHRHSLDGVTSRLRFFGCLVRASLTFARWLNQSSPWVRNRDQLNAFFGLSYRDLRLMDF